MTGPDTDESVNPDAPLDAALARLLPAVRARAQAFERQRRLPDDIARAMAAAGIYRLLVPRALGGLEVTPETFAAVLARVAAADAATGWCAMIGATAAFPSGEKETLSTVSLCPSILSSCFPVSRSQSRMLRSVTLIGLPLTISGRPQPESNRLPSFETARQRTGSSWPTKRRVSPRSLRGARLNSTSARGVHPIVANTATRIIRE